jgi:hypothetical protein
MKGLQTLTASLVFSTLIAGSCSAQQTKKNDQSYFGAIFNEEKADIKAGCQDKEADGKSKPIKKFIPGCVENFFHGNKGLYASFASLPPGNGVALGAVFKDSELNTKHWRMNYQIDSQGAFNSSWTAGGLLTMRWSPAEIDTSKKAKPRMVVVQGPLPKHLPEFGETETKLLINNYAFHTSLNQVAYYGIGPDTSRINRAFFGLRETITGVNADYLLKYGFHLLGDINGRWPEIGSDHGQSSPSIEQLYSETTAPGLALQPGFLQLGEGLQYASHLPELGEKSIFGIDADLDYGVNFQQFVAPNDSELSFQRLTLDITNDLHLFKTFTPKNGSATSEQFGTLELREWLATSFVPSGHTVPFYFQPTLGGGDIDTERTLASFADYRFRAPNALLFRAQYEEPLPKFSFLGFVFRADAGKVADTRDDLGLSHLRHSFGAGVTFRAGNFPYLTIMYAWAGEGTHTFADLNASAISRGGGMASLW